jgi:hypothetical protein
VERVPFEGEQLEDGFRTGPAPDSSITRRSPERTSKRVCIGEAQPGLRQSETPVRRRSLNAHHAKQNRMSLPPDGPPATRGAPILQEFQEDATE